MDHPMPFDGTDVQDVARSLEKRGTFLRRLIGPKFSAAAVLLRQLWLAGEETANKLATVENAYELASYELYDLRHRLKNSTAFLIDQAIECYKGKAFVIVLSPAQFHRLDNEYDCPDKFKASTRERWAYTYRGYRIFTMTGIQGPLLVDVTKFAAFDALRQELTLREM